MKIKTLQSSVSLLKAGIWIYFFLLIFEGALRKWVLPGLATPLLIIRDPIALWLIFTAWNRGLLPSTLYLTGMFALGVIGIFTALTFGHGNLVVALFGARLWLIHFPMIFVIGRVFNKEDVLKMGRVVLWMALPMLVLIVLQFYSPQSAWVNRGLGNDTAGAGFSGALGFFRPPATFSFTNGTAFFFSLVSVFVFYFWLNPTRIHKILLITASLVLLLCIPFAMSRTLLFQICIGLVFLMVASLKSPKFAGRFITGAMVVALVAVFLSQTSFFDNITRPFLTRFSNASGTEGGIKGTLGDRFLGGMLLALERSADQPFFGYGLGMGTNAGSSLLVGRRAFLISEEEWGRVIGELGPLMGLLVIFIRVTLSVHMAVASYHRMARGDALGWMLLGFGVVLLAEGQWAQPTALGFSTVVSGLLLSELKIFPDLKPA